MTDEKKVVDFFTNKMIKDQKGFSKYSFTNGMKYTLSSLFEKTIVPWMKQCLTKYTPGEFHDRMYNGRYEFDGRSYIGFDFIEDWNKNHAQKMIMLKRASRSMQKFLDFDVHKIMDTIEEFMNENGYSLNFEERQCIYHTIVKVYRTIYGT